MNSIVQEFHKTIARIDSSIRKTYYPAITVKCKVLTVSRKKQPVDFTYQLGSTTLSRVEKEKDLNWGYNDWESFMGFSYL
jgi:hypothetical protein